jgi:hypothetical protein
MTRTETLSTSSTNNPGVLCLYMSASRRRNMEGFSERMGTTSSYGREPEALVGSRVKD